ncbi:hypothetical protein MPDQ_005671 [Monascus purpureus]|uniref:Fungal-specific transcription factor domain-containing protein n=1 Tax=Monascus purpureus TaxID=5098 RepID=A0A507QYA8_MONPU|nr:hypothetical protein MPDQ_005671 [Monascus purpureus]BDD56804.1 hypothetical protein MAP00_002226 [Monascus purpureus]
MNDNSSANSSCLSFPVSTLSSVQIPPISNSVQTPESQQGDTEINWPELALSLAAENLPALNRMDQLDLDKLLSPGSSAQQTMRFPHTLGLEANEPYLTQVQDYSTRIIKPLPFLVDGIRSPSERKMFYHYHEVLAKVLLLETTINPFVSELIPKALSDNRGSHLLAAILSLSASHYQHLMSMSGAQIREMDQRSIESLKWGSHRKAVQQHAHMLDRVDSDSSDLRELFILTMILHQFSLCEGGDSPRWQKLLDIARGLVRQLYCDGQYDTREREKLDYFVLDWFYFHDVCSSLTSHGQRPCIDMYSQSLHSSGLTSPAVSLASEYAALRPSGPGIFLIGPRDGLLPIITRIINLRRSSAADRRPISNAEMYTYALRIEEDLRNWNFDYDRPEIAAVAEAYRLSAFLLLWFTIHPHGPLEHEKVKDIVRDGLGLLASVSPEDSAQTCSLLPIFVFAVSTESVEDHDLVRQLIRSYGSWACLGNIMEVETFLQQWWLAAEKINKDKRSWWDWELYLKENGISIALV